MENDSKPQRLYELDLLRFIAAMTVVLFHYGFRGYAADNLTVMPLPWLAPAVKYGYLGVNLFFMISGYVIWMTAAGGSAKRFIISRIVRLYPAFWACCSLTFVVILLAGDARFTASLRQYLLNMSMLSGFLGVDSIDGVYWSLLVEMKFYALVLVVILAGQIHRAKELLGLWLVLVLCVSVRHVRYVDFFLITDYAPYFIAGAMFYLIRSEGACAYKLFVVAASYLVAAKDALSYALDKQIHYLTPFSGKVVVLMLAAFFIAFTLLATRRLRVPASDKWLLLGALTYPLYLIHQNIGFIFFDRLYPAWNPTLIMLVTIALMLAAAYAAHRFVERPLAKPLRAVLEKFFGVLPRALSPA